MYRRALTVVHGLAQFSVSKLFAALRGAWLEPQSGAMWQENTGVTPTTTGGQTIGLLLDQSQGAVLGPELMSVSNGRNGFYSYTTNQYGHDIPTGWGNYYNAGNPASIVSAVVANGTYTITAAAGNAFAGMLAPTLPKSRVYLSEFRIRRISGLATIAHYTGTWVPLSLPEGEWVTISLTCFRTDPLQVFSLGGGNTTQNTAFEISYISVRQVLGNHAYQDTAANRPVYGARYNLLTYTEDFSNAAWAKTTTGSATAIQFTNNYAVAPDGTTTAARFTATVTGTVASDQSAVQRGSGQTLPQSITTSLWVKSNTGSEQNVWFRGGSSSGASVPVTNNWTKITDSGKIDYFTLGLRGSITGISSIDILVWHPDQRLTSDVGKNPEYQRVTTATDYDYGQYPAVRHDATDTLTCSLPNLGGGVFSSAGSVYFATPVGMSALHNQSMGTSYNLPALSSDIYSWMVFPQRLSTAQETQLERYMLGKAGLAAPTYLTDNTDGFLADDSGNDIILAA